MTIGDAFSVKVSKHTGHTSSVDVAASKHARWTHMVLHPIVNIMLSWPMRLCWHTKHSELLVAIVFFSRLCAGCYGKTCSKKEDSKKILGILRAFGVGRFTTLFQ